MSKRLLVVGLVLLMSAGLWAQAAASGGDVESTLLDIEKKWVEAAKTSNASAMDSILADGFVTMGTDGKYKTKQEYVAGFSKGKWEKNEVSNLKVKVNGDYAVVMGDWTGKGMDAEGKKVDTTEHWIDTFAKQPDGSWKAISSAATPAAGAAKAAKAKTKKM